MKQKGDFAAPIVERLSHEELTPRMELILVQ